MAGRRIEMLINKIGMPLDKMAEAENAAAQAARSKALEDYNIMMGNIEDPSEDEEEGDGEDD